MVTWLKKTHRSQNDNTYKSMVYCRKRIHYINSTSTAQGCFTMRDLEKPGLRSRCPLFVKATHMLFLSRARTQWQVHGTSWNHGAQIGVSAGVSYTLLVIQIYSCYIISLSSTALWGLIETRCKSSMSLLLINNAESWNKLASNSSDPWLQRNTHNLHIPGLGQCLPGTLEKQLRSIPGFLESPLSIMVRPFGPWSRSFKT